MRDMTKGNITRHMLWFAVPLMLGNVFQQLYGTVSAVIVGRHLGKEALAAMGTAIPVMNIMLFLLVGMTMGVSILMAEFFGAADFEKLKKEFATSLIAGAVFTLFLSITGILTIEPALRLINAPAAIIPQAVAYLRVIFFGLIFAFLYNLLSSALRAIGESFVPVLFLVFSSILNIALAFLFVGAMGYGVRGAALATVLAEAAATFCCVLYIWLKVPLLHLRAREMRADASLLPATVSYSWVSGVQQTFLYVGIFLVQGAVNALGVDAIAAFNAVSRIEGFILAPSDSLAASLMMFVSQNKGAERRDRISQGLCKSAWIIAVYTALSSLAIFVLAHRLMLFFLPASDLAPVHMGVQYMRVMCAFYMLSAFCNSFQGFFRGLGLVRIALYATFVQIPVRVLLSYGLTRFLGLDAIAVAVGVGWMCMLVYHRHEYRKCAPLWRERGEGVERNEVRFCR